MPIANVTKAAQEVKMQIESEIDEIESAIKMFQTRKPVYITTNDSRGTPL